MPQYIFTGRKICRTATGTDAPRYVLQWAGHILHIQWLELKAKVTIFHDI